MIWIIFLLFTTYSTFRTSSTKIFERTLFSNNTIMTEIYIDIFCRPFRPCIPLICIIWCRTFSNSNWSSAMFTSESIRK